MGVRPATMPGDGVGLRGRRKANTLLGLFKPGSEVRLTERKSVWGRSSSVGAGESRSPSWTVRKTLYAQVDKSHG